MPREALDAIRQKYPQYADVPDVTLARTIIQKYPQYGDLIGDIANGQADESPAASSPAAAVIQPQRGIMEQVASGAWQGVKNLASGAAGLLTTPVTAPFRAAADWVKFTEDPPGTLKAKGQEAAAFAKGMIPMRETGAALLSGETPSPETVSREATEAGLGFLGAKYGPPAIVKGAKGVVKRLPGASVELNEVAAENLRKIPGTVAPGPGVTQGLYTTLKSMQAPKVEMAKTQQVVADLLAKEGTLASPDKLFVKLLRNLQGRIGTGMSFENIQNNIVDFGEKIGQIQANKGTKLGEMKDLVAAMHEDRAAGIPAGGLGGPSDPALMAKSQAWDAARKSARRGFAANELNEMIEKSGITTVGEGFTQVNTNAIVKQIEDMVKLAGQNKRAKLFVESFDPGELDKITQTLKDIGRTAPKIPAKAGTPVGSSERWTQGAVGTLAGTVVGHPGVGAAIGVLTPKAVSKLMMTETGRALVRRAVGPTGTISPQGAALLGAFLKAEGGAE